MAGLLVAVCGSWGAYYDVDVESAPFYDPGKPPWPTAYPSPPAPTTVGDSGGRVTVVEQGFAQRFESVRQPGVPVPYSPVQSAFVLRNSSADQIAIRVTALVRYFDGAGKPVIEYGKKSPDNEVLVAMIEPGQRVGVTDFLIVQDTRVASMRITVEGASWVSPAEAAALKVARLWATDVTVVPTGSDKITILTFTVHNADNESRLPSATALLRNKAGKLLGSSDTDAYQITYPPGTSQGSLTLDGWLPPGTDLDRTQITFDDGSLRLP